MHLVFYTTKYEEATELNYLSFFTTQCIFLLQLLNLSILDHTNESLLYSKQKGLKIQILFRDKGEKGVGKTMRLGNTGSVLLF